MDDNRILGKYAACSKIWLCEPSAQFSGDLESFIKQTGRMPMRCGCEKQGRISLLKKGSEIYGLGKCSSGKLL